MPGAGPSRRGRHGLAAVDQLRVYEAQELVGGEVEVVFGPVLVRERIADPGEGVEQFRHRSRRHLARLARLARAAVEDSTEDSTR